MAHGYMSARVKGHADKRRRDWRRVMGVKAPTGEVNVAGWYQAAALLGQNPRLGSVESEPRVTEVVN